MSNAFCMHYWFTVRGYNFEVTRRSNFEMVSSSTIPSLEVSMTVIISDIERYNIS